MQEESGHMVGSAWLSLAQLGRMNHEEPSVLSNRLGTIPTIPFQVTQLMGRSRPGFLRKPGGSHSAIHIVTVTRGHI